MHTTKHIIALAVVLIASAVGVGLFLAPSHKEIALMHMDDQDFKTAINNFSSLHDAGDHTINVLAPLINLNVYYGDVDKSIEHVEPERGSHRSGQRRQEPSDDSAPPVPREVTAFGTRPTQRHVQACQVSRRCFE